MPSIEAIIEIPQGSGDKYELDAKSGEFVLDCVLEGGFNFPFNYGSIPQTLEEDGDPLDICVLTRNPIPQGSKIAVNIFGVIDLVDRGVSDKKLLAVVEGDDSMKDISDLSEFRKQIYTNFFLEVGRQKQKEMIIKGYLGKSDALGVLE